MNQTIDEKSFREISNHVYEVSKKAMLAIHNFEKLNDMLKNDHRIAYEYMKQNSTFLNTIEHGILYPQRNLSERRLIVDVSKDMSFYTGGNPEVHTEYMNNKEFEETILLAYTKRVEVQKELNALEDTFAQHRYPIEQMGVQAIIHKAEHDKYDIFMQPELLEKELRQELSELIRHEPYKKSEAEIAKDQIELERQKISSRNSDWNERVFENLEQRRKEYDELNAEPVEPMAPQYTENAIADDPRYREVLEQVTQLSNETIEAREQLNELKEVLKNDERINYTYMTQRENVFDLIESRSNIDFDEMKHDLYRFSQGNAKLVNEYENNPEFVEKVTEVIGTYQDLEEKRIDFIFSFDKAESDVARLITEKIKNYEYNPSQDTFEDQFKVAFKQLQNPDKPLIDYMRNMSTLDRQTERGLLLPEDGFRVYRKDRVLGIHEELEANVNVIKESLETRGFDTETPEFRKIEAKLLTGKYPEDYREFDKAITIDLESIHPTLERLDLHEKEMSLYNHEKHAGPTLQDKEEYLSKIEREIPRDIELIERFVKENSISDDKGFRNIFSEAKHGRLTGPHEIETLLKAYDVQSVSPELVNRLSDVNRNSFIIKNVSPKLRVERERQNVQINPLLNKIEKLQGQNKEFQRELEKNKLEKEQAKLEKEQNKPKRSIFSLER